ncbi:MAG: hypothetical protein LBJ95_01985 [Oscillospiraceae bacterium]|jgi:hypothetical protein|nr:hypothetical protein [Oscillospiraceae bacterium]
MYIVKISWLKKAASKLLQNQKKDSRKGEYCTIFRRKPTSSRCPSMAEQQAKFSQINVDINQILSINIHNNMSISH